MKEIIIRETVDQNGDKSIQFLINGFTDYEAIGLLTLYKNGLEYKCLKITNGDLNTQVDRTKDVRFVNLNTSNRLLNAIKHNSMNLFNKKDYKDIWISDFSTITKRQVLMCRNLGKRSLDELYAILNEYNIKFL